MARDAPPLWQALRTAIDKQGVSVRQLAKLSHEARPSQSVASWRRTIMRALDEDAAKPYYPSKATAEVWARALGLPAETFFRRRPKMADRLRAEIDRLLVENESLARRLEELEAERSGDG